MQSNGMRLRTKLKEFSAAVKWLVASDRHEFVERKAYDAQIAHDNNNVKRCLAVVRALHGGKPRAHTTILRKSGEKTQNEDQRKERWQEHRADVFQGSIIEFHRYRSAQGGSHEHCPELDLSPEAMEVSIAMCRRHKATGRDLLSNEVMQAGGRPMAELASEVAIKIADTERWPNEFQGGRVTELFQKREPTEL